MLTIHLNNLLFHSYHGHFKEEKILGNEFSVDLIVKYISNSSNIQCLEESIDYALLFELIKKRMNQPSDLLETIVEDIANQILNEFTLAEYVSCKLTKLYPPIPTFRGSVSVSCEKNRNI